MAGIDKAKQARLQSLYQCDGIILLPVYTAEGKR
jgi:hypothetical protein